MADLNTEEIKKLKKGELCGLIATGVAGVVLIALGVLIIIAAVRENSDLRLYACGFCMPVIGVCSIIAAICNLKYGKALDGIIKDYVKDVFVENAELMHPERDILNYSISNEGNKFFVKANNFKEQITFDFSAFGKLTIVRKSTIITAIIERLGTTFCRLMERGGKYKNVTYCAVKDGKQGKTINIIENGTPDKRAYRNYLKQK